MLALSRVGGSGDIFLRKILGGGGGGKLECLGREVEVFAPPEP